MSNLSSGYDGILTANDISIEVDAVVGMDIDESIWNDVAYITSIAMDDNDNIYVSVDIGWSSQSSIVQKYDSNLNLIWSEIFLEQ